MDCSEIQTEIHIPEDRTDSWCVSDSLPSYLANTLGCKNGTVPTTHIGLPLWVNNASKIDIKYHSLIIKTHLY